MPTIEEVFAAIKRERDFQTNKWGPLEKRPHEIASWLLIMEEEMREAKQGWLKVDGKVRREGKMLAGNSLEEILQVIAVGCACLEQHGIVERFPKFDEAPQFHVNEDSWSAPEAAK